MRAVMVKFSSLEADHSLRPPLPLQRVQAGGALSSVRGRDQGDMKVDACDAACAMDHKISGFSKSIVEFLYTCIIEARSSCA
jgi:hypothetical protein